MRTRFMLANRPQYWYIAEIQAQKEYQQYLKDCSERIKDRWATYSHMWLPFAVWLAYMEYKIY